MQEEFYLKLYLFKPNRVPPIRIARDSQLQITVELMDYTIPGGSTAAAFSTGSFFGKVYTQACTVDGNRITFTPQKGFFVPGKNILQYEINNGVIPLAIDVNCEISLPDGGKATEPEQVLPLVTRAENAAKSAEDSKKAAAELVGKIPDFQTQINALDTGKVSKEEGKGLSSNDYDNESKEKVDAIPEDPKYTDTVTPVDATLSIDGEAADAKATGDVLNQIKDDLDDLSDKNNSLEKIGFIVKNGVINLFDKNTVIDGYYVEPSNGNLVASNGKFTSDYIHVKANHTYSYRCNEGLYGNQTKYLPLYTEDKTFKKYLTGTISAIDTFKINTFTPNEDGYVMVSNFNSLIDKMAFIECSAEDYPTELVERSYNLCDELKEIPNNGTVGQVLTKTEDGYSWQNTSENVNQLYEKTAIFFGDSICAGESSGTASPYYLWGWAGRIGTKNNMTWENYGFSGATIATGTSASVKILPWFNQKKTKYPNADYIIFEGGTNDADLLGNDGLGTFEPRNFSGGYATTTFTGALEQLFHDAITSYPFRKIGYIIPQKMGKTDVLVARRRAYFDRAIEICKKWGIPYIDLWETCNLNWNLSCYYDSSKTSSENLSNGMAYVDGQHLSDVGYDMITPLIEEWMKTL